MVLEITSDTTDVRLYDIRGESAKLVKIPLPDNFLGEERFFAISFHAGTGADSILFPYGDVHKEAVLITHVEREVGGDANRWDIELGYGLYDTCRLWNYDKPDPVDGVDWLDVSENYGSNAGDGFGPYPSTYLWVNNEFGWRSNPNTHLYEYWTTGSGNPSDGDQDQNVVSAIAVENILVHPGSPSYATFDVVFGPMPDSSSISLSDTVIATCPAVDADSLVIAVSLRDIYGNPVDGVPADSVWAVASPDTSTGVAVCGSDYFTAFASSATDSNGQTTIILPDLRLVGCGRAAVNVYAYGIHVGQDSVEVRSLDTNANCIVGDDGEWIPQTSCGDFDGSGGSPASADSALYLAHVGHSDVLLPDSCTVAISDTVVATCPAMDADSVIISVTLIDGQGMPVQGFSADSVWAVAARDSTVLKCRCASDTVTATTDTDEEGQTSIVFADLIGCGGVSFDVYAEVYGMEILLGEDSVTVRGLDTNANCIVGDDGESIPQTSCGDFDDDGTYSASGDSATYDAHVGHFYVDGAYSASVLNISPVNFLRYCPEGDTTGTYKSSYFVVSVKLRDGYDRTVPNVPGDSIYIQIPSPTGSAFRFLCGSSNRRVWADDDADSDGVTSVTAPFGGGRSVNVAVDAYVAMLADTAFVGTATVDTIRSFDIDGSGKVARADMSTFSSDYMQYLNFGIYNYRSNFDGGPPWDVDDDDFDFMNYHYRDQCGSAANPDSIECADFAEEDITGVRQVVPNAILDGWIGRATDYELNRFLQCVRELPEPDTLAVIGEKTPQAVTAMLLPARTLLGQNYPNPFGSGTLIKYQVAAPAGHVTILIFDVAGRLVRTLLDTNMAPGFYDVPWDGRNDSGREVASGIYFYQMKAPGFRSDKKMMMIR